MTHNEKRTTWIKEGGIGLATGVLFGLTNVVIGHVFNYFLIQLRKTQCLKLYFLIILF